MILANEAAIGNPRKIGLLAGWGQYPVQVARRLQQSGFDVYCLGVVGHFDQEIAQYCRQVKPIGLCRFGAAIRFFRRHEVKHATMAGKIFKTKLLEPMACWKHLPDLTSLRYFYHHFISGRKNRNDDALLSTVTQAFLDNGISFLPATAFVPELLVKEGLLTLRPITQHHWKDIAYGWKLAKEMGRLDIGQSIAVKGRAVLAVEAIEGTDECIRRAGQLCPAGGFSIVKVAKPDQDMRFDVPTVGLGTIQTMRAVGARVLAIESQKTIILNQDEMIAFANGCGISIIAVTEASLRRQRLAA